MILELNIELKHRAKHQATENLVYLNSLTYSKQLPSVSTCNLEYTVI